MKEMKINIVNVETGKVMFEYKGNYVPRIGEMVFWEDCDGVLEVDYVATKLIERDNENVIEYVEVGVSLN